MDLRNNITKPCYAMSMAFAASARAKDANTKCGATVEFSNGDIITGYNGAPPDFDDACLQASSIKHPVIIHAERNALYRAGFERCRQQMPNLYVTFKPCPPCLLTCYAFNVKEIFYYSDYESETCNSKDTIMLIERYAKRIIPITKYSVEKYGKLIIEHNWMGVKS